MKKIWILIIIIILSVIIGFLLYKNFHKDKLVIPEYTSDNNVIKDVLDSDFELKMIHAVDQQSKDNYLISPVSLAYALNMLKEGADTSTLEELNNLLNNYNPHLKSYEDNILLANGLFIRDEYKDLIKNDYTTTLKKKYDAEVIYDPFKSPNNFNNWVSNKTKKMINKVLDQVDPMLSLILVNTLTLDIKWVSPFECINTLETDFTKKDGTKIKTAMMNGTANAYFEDDSAQGIIKDYLSYDNQKLEYIAILPKNVDNFVKNLTLEKLNSLINNQKEYSKINLALPKYTYDYNYTSIKKDFMALGVHDLFDDNKADLSKIADIKGQRLYVNDIIHKTHIEMFEEGTKASAVTAIPVFSNSALINENVINIKFDKPFIYLIRNKDNHNILFFGFVNSPLDYKDNTCDVKAK